jgi:hypothetical protein
MLEKKLWFVDGRKRSRYLIYYTRNNKLCLFSILLREKKKTLFSLYRSNFFSQNSIDAYRFGRIVVVVSFNQVSLSLFLLLKQLETSHWLFSSFGTVCAWRNIQYIIHRRQQRSIGFYLASVYLSLPFIDFWRLSLGGAKETCCCAKPCFRSTSSLQLNTDILNSVGARYFFPYRFLPPSLFFIP